MVKNMSERSLETRIELGQDGIVRLKQPVGTKMGLTEAKAIVAALVDLGKGSKILLINDLREHQGFTSNREARAYMAGKETGDVVQASAFLIGSPVSKVVGNFFMSVNKPLFPIRMFTSEAEAVEWLKGFLETKD